MAGRRRGTVVEGPSEPGAGFTVLDGAALVVGAAVASIHVRGMVLGQPAGTTSAMVWLTFAGVALTSAGPLVFLLRRFGHRPAGYPRTGDALWALLGLPWLITGVLRAIPRFGPRWHALYSFGLIASLWLTSLTTLAVVWRTWVAIPPEQVERDWAHSWTNRLGLVLAVAWPLQCGFGLVIVGP